MIYNFTSPMIISAQVKYLQITIPVMIWSLKIAHILSSNKLRYFPTNFKETRLMRKYNENLNILDHGSK